VDDALLAKAIVAGDRAAFRSLVERESGTIVRVCARIIGDPYAAEDVAQDTFVIALQSIGSWRGDGSLRAWLVRIAMNRAFRAAQFRSRSISLEAGPEDWTGASSGDEPLVDLISAERRQAVQRAVAGLPEPYRETIALRFFAELPLAEIAALTGRPLGTVKTHLGRGLRRLRVTLAEARAA
jgi:RNA polymerase sigma-70 factor (ECF subfamily)